MTWQAGRRSQSSGCVGVVQAMKSLRTRWLEGSGVAFFHASYIFRPEKKGKEKVRHAGSTKGAAEVRRASWLTIRAGRVVMLWRCGR